MRRGHASSLAGAIGAALVVGVACYIGEPVGANDHKGVGVFLLAAAELDR